MNEILFIAGISLIFVGIFLILLSAIIGAKGKAEYGGIVFIGPIPITFGSSKEMVYLAILIGILMILFLIAMGIFKL
ncbi:MAG: hypothetical protein B6U78_02225 [Candidatus Aenigmarchaeota archaeon ex4484_224]|nr:MAG: hypothetical protein B6U78_02225 [Candidatus Aenigmarchaeota archaeon ex4484_224]